MKIIMEMTFDAYPVHIRDSHFHGEILTQNKPVLEPLLS